MKAIKDIIRGMISDSNTGVRTAVLKFLELQILAQSLKTTDSETKKSADGGLEIVPLRHPILDVSATDRSPAVNFPITIMPSHIHTLTHSLAHSLTLTHPSTHPPTPTHTMSPLPPSPPLPFSAHILSRYSICSPGFVLPSRDLVLAILSGRWRSCGLMAGRALSC